MTNVQFPVIVNDYHKIEKQNNININVFGYENKQKHPIYVSKEQFHDHLNLLMIIINIVVIKDFNRFCYDQTKHEHRKSGGMYCLQFFTKQDILHKHKEIVWLLMVNEQ